MNSSVDRNQPCPCGSGKKHKNCCGRAGLTFTKKRQKQAYIALAAVIALVSIVLLLQRTDSANSSPSPVGFNTTAGSGQLTPQPSGEVPAGKIWSPEHGHWHDANTIGNFNPNNALTPTASGSSTPQPSGPVPAGKIWSPEHGHWHDVSGIGSTTTGNTQAQPGTGQNPISQPPGEAPAGQVWSPDHGHWHDAITGRSIQSSQSTSVPQPPGDVPPGKIWSPEHGHWHDAKIINPGAGTP